MAPCQCTQKRMAREMKCYPEGMSAGGTLHPKMTEQRKCALRLSFVSLSTGYSALHLERCSSLYKPFEMEPRLESKAIELLEGLKRASLKNNFKPHSKRKMWKTHPAACNSDNELQTISKCVIPTTKFGLQDWRSGRLNAAMCGCKRFKNWLNGMQDY